MDKVLLATLIEEAEESLKLSPSIVHREMIFPKIPEMIQVAIGMRRTGKTYFLFQTTRELLEQGVSREQILYINFEDDRLLPMDRTQLAHLIDGFYSLYPENHDRTCYLFLDEIQNVEGWPLVVRRLFDSKNVRLYLSGSSAKLLSKEIASTLRGRSISTEVWPYSFQEYLKASAIDLPKQPLSTKKLDIYRKHLETYLVGGGFPAVQKLPENERRMVLQSYVDFVVFRDITERYGIANTTLLKYLIKTLVKNAATPFSINKFHKNIKSQGYSAGRDTLYHYMSYIEDTFLAFAVPIFSESHRKREVNPKKIYAIDTGLVTANLLAHDNFGPLFENLVYLDLRRLGCKIYYYKTQDDYEIDFVVKHRDGRMEMLQVVWDLSSPAVCAREERALKQAEEELKIPGRIIDPVTYLHDFL